MLLIAMFSMALTPEYFTIHTTGGDLSYKIGDIRKVVFDATQSGNMSIYQKRSSTPAQYPYLTLEWLTFEAEAGVNEISVAENGIQIVTFLNELRVSSTQALQTVQIYNLNGELIYNSDSNENEVEISIDNYSKGIYIVKAETAETIKTEKVVKY